MVMYIANQSTSIGIPLELPRLATSKGSIKIETMAVTKATTFTQHKCIIQL